MIATAHDTALLFNHRNGDVQFVPFDGELTTLYKLLKVKMIDTIRLDRKHVIFVDDDGFYKQYKTGFQLTYKGEQIKFVGSGLLVGDSNGSSAPLDLGFDDLKIDVLKLSYETREETGEEEGL
jgi:hypothetical protein